jgi:hypothetical protein
MMKNKSNMLGCIFNNPEDLFKAEAVYRKDYDEQSKQNGTADPTPVRFLDGCDEANCRCIVVCKSLLIK